VEKLNEIVYIKET